MNDLTRILVANHLEEYFTNTYFKQAVDQFVEALPYVISGFVEPARHAKELFEKRCKEAFKSGPRPLIIDPTDMQFNLEGIKNATDES
jgi:hypothetical protein